MAVMFLGTGTLQTEAYKRCAEFAVCLKGQEAHETQFSFVLAEEVSL